jgi:hypothetical protein
MGFVVPLQDLKKDARGTEAAAAANNRTLGARNREGILNKCFIGKILRRQHFASGWIASLASQLLACVVQICCCCCSHRFCMYPPRFRPKARFCVLHVSLPGAFGTRARIPLSPRNFLMITTTMHRFIPNCSSLNLLSSAALFQR